MKIHRQTDRQTDRFLTRRFWLAAVVFVFTASSLTGCNFDSNSSLRSNSVASKDSIAKKPNQKIAEAFQLTFPGEPDAPVVPNVPPDLFGHHPGCSSTDYDIWRLNCHTAANEFCLDSNRKMPSAACGIVKCAAQFDNESIQGHTFNWRIEGNQTCFYNWGNKECVDGTTVPPDMSRDDITYLVLEMCGPGQAIFERPEALKPGENVEYPGSSACLDELIASNPGLDPTDGKGKTVLKDFLEFCLKCCDTRADTWPCNKDDSKCADKVEFLKECKDLCRYPGKIRQHFIPPKAPEEELAIRRGVMCSGKPIPMIGSIWRKPLVCRECCSKAADNNDFIERPLRDDPDNTDLNPEETAEKAKLINVCVKACLNHTPDPTDPK